MSFRPIATTTLLLSCLISSIRTSGFSQASSSDPSFTRHESSQGQVFLPVAGTTVMFARYETRVSDYEEFSRTGTYPWSFRPHFKQNSDEPVVGVNLQDAIAYCNWLTEKERAAGHIKSSQAYRLPTAEEWSAAVGLLAARKEELNSDQKFQEIQRFVWGLDWPPPAESGNFQHKEIPGYEDSYLYTAPAGKFKPTAEGLYDLAGNVWEWTWDRQLTANSEGKLRGGSWAYFRKETLYASYVYTVPADLRAPTIGFRCVFEDRQRTAELLAKQSAARKDLENKRMADMSKGVDKEAVDRVLRQAKETFTALKLDVSKLTPASSGQPFTSSSGLKFIPLPEVKFLAGRTEVTLAAMSLWSAEQKKELPTQPGFNNLPDHPVVNVSWDMATAFCQWLTEHDRRNKLIPSTASYRLPTDAEWSQLAGLQETGGDPATHHLKNTTHFVWGENLWPPADLSANLDAPKITPPYRDTYSYTSPVEKHKPTSSDLHDLGGNVSEWVADVWPEAASEHVIRGGSWLLSEKLALLTSARQHRAANFTRYDLGFRLLLDLGQP